ncbi:MAG: DNA starvation/stationary phase protection protein Dps [Alphaproteobacteria bacterium]|nr:DNA starvation/stationary phase protection protein Dps [Alphaproteobacteria bacterium]
MSAVPELKTQPSSVIDLLNQSLAGAIDLKLQAKQAHWNVKGENFIALHELFDTVSAQADGYADMIAERAVQLGGIAQGTVQTIARDTKLAVYPVDMHDSQRHVKALSTAMSTLADFLRSAIDSSDESGDAVTADLLTEATRGLDKLRWFVESHISA